MQYQTAALCTRKKETPYQELKLTTIDTGFIQ